MLFAIESVWDSWEALTAWIAVFDVLLTVFVINVILNIKRESTSAVAWCMLVILLPIVGSIFFYIFGYQAIHRPLQRKQKQSRNYRQQEPAGPGNADPTAEHPHPGDPVWQDLVHYARSVDGFPATDGNAVEAYHEGEPFFAALFDAVQAATHHIHIEFFIFRSDETGRKLIDLLCEKAKSGVEVRFLYDAVGGHDLRSSLLRQLRRAGGKTHAFLPILNPLRRFRLNLRNHRKILVVDGRIGFVGGFNIGGEYLGLNPSFGFWRDSHVRLEGPAVRGLQRTFLEDWNFADGETVQGEAYFPRVRTVGHERVQILRSGPDQELKTVREVLFAAILRARKRVWITTPYFVPDAGLRDALHFAARSGIDVRIICPLRPDKWIPFLAARHYWVGMLDAGVKIYQYSRGFMHAKMMIVDDGWATVGSANLDNRSLLLNFECNAVLYSPDSIEGLAAQFLKDLSGSIRLNPSTFATRPYLSRFAEKVCWLLSPVL
ncbi:cardiolipin synthase [Tuwongella immobilis]|uniref:Cardiolipin synthase n=1 Tax=Tuwongella immobilis TaxID=692036 RepID=A0A6C2YI55_9BACT|nr:cardiolipin synthase [Tuwongella immobilis]VIP00745.1 cardiolipin synthetase : Cardiolipin synthetase OS=Geobacillus stearothermophilus GN=ET31_10575 PE=3 SV=1: PLDc_N: PLDc_2: PLDc_2 [Tuwongella immobilis]VTR96908.1 cardiolipin synthetase : Cardiolipin synthetase OS=Geobacillus stearothermophilus GN=ET31_10575 PE=3 SV=1: PLDc_N: PLDc_2: PLDc_2 [Tuwongella immobilis]